MKFLSFLGLMGLRPPLRFSTLSGCLPEDSPPLSPRADATSRVIRVHPGDFGSGSPDELSGLGSVVTQPSWPAAKSLIVERYQVTPKALDSAPRADSLAAESTLLIDNYRGPSFEAMEAALRRSSRVLLGLEELARVTNETIVTESVESRINPWRIVREMERLAPEVSSQADPATTSYAAPGERSSHTGEAPEVPGQISSDARVGPEVPVELLEHTADAPEVTSPSATAEDTYEALAQLSTNTEAQQKVVQACMSCLSANINMKRILDQVEAGVEGRTRSISHQEEKALQYLQQLTAMAHRLERGYAPSRMLDVTQETCEYVNLLTTIYDSMQTALTLLL